MNTSILRKILQVSNSFNGRAEMKCLCEVKGFQLFFERKCRSKQSFKYVWDEKEPGIWNSGK